MKKSIRDMELSDLQLETELRRTMLRKKRWAAVKKSVSILLVLTAFLVLISAIWLPIYHINVTTPASGFSQNQVVVAFRTSRLKFGDMVVGNDRNAYYIGTIIGKPGDAIFIDESNALIVHDTRFTKWNLSEEITSEKMLPEESYLIWDDQESIAKCIKRDSIAGRVVMQIWPLHQIGSIE